MCALGLNLSVAFFSWLRRHYVLNKRILPIQRHNVISFGLLIFSGLAWYISIDAIDSDSMSLQVTAGVFATLLSWLAKTVIVNEAYVVYRFQYVALPFEFATEVLRQMQVWLLVNSVVDESQS